MGLYNLSRKKNDRREFLLSLTDAGNALYEEVNTELKADIQELFSSIDSGKLDYTLQNTQTLC